MITPSHNPPEDGGFKYNPPNGGPADTDVTGWIERAANRYLEDDLEGRQADPLRPRAQGVLRARHDYIGALCRRSRRVVDMEAIRAAGVKIGIDPLGGAAVRYWQPIIERYGSHATVVSDAVDPTFRFMTVDWDGKIRMDCSSPYAMARLIGMRDRFDVAFANDTDADRHGIVTRSSGLMNPNHYLAVAISYLFEHRPHWRGDSAVGKTMVSSAIIDRVASETRPPAGRNAGRIQMVRRRPDRRLVRIRRRGKRRRVVPAARRHGVDHRQGRHHPGPARGGDHGAHQVAIPSQVFDELTRELGVPFYERIDAPATPAQKKLLKALSPDKLAMKELAGETVRATLTAAPGNGAPIGGIKVVSRQRLVRGAAFRHRGCLQDLCRELSRAKLTCGRSSRRRRPPSRGRSRAESGMSEVGGSILRDAARRRRSSG